MYDKIKQILIKFYGNANALKEIWEVIKPPKRSLGQNSLYWLWLTCISQETGNEKDFLHLFFRQQYLGYKESIVFGEIVNSLISTTDLRKQQFKQYLDKIQIFANSELNIFLPNPDDLNFKHFQEYYNKFI